MVDMKPRKSFPVKKKYTAKEFFEFTKNKPENERYELIDGEICRVGDTLMSAPKIKHQRIIREIISELRDYLKDKTCEPFVSPVDVVLFEKEKDRDKSQNVFQPDIFVVCDPEKITEDRIYGAPDFVIEVVSPSNSKHDDVNKLHAYIKYGVKEFWLIMPETDSVQVYTKEEKEKMQVDFYTFTDKIKVGIFEDFEIDFNELQI